MGELHCEAGTESGTRGEDEQLATLREERQNRSAAVGDIFAYLQEIL